MRPYYWKATPSQQIIVAHSTPAEIKKKQKSAGIGITGFLRTFPVVLPGFEPRQAEPKTAVLPLHHKTILFAQAHKEPKAPQS